MCGGGGGGTNVSVKTTHFHVLGSQTNFIQFKLFSATIHTKPPAVMFH